MSKIPWSEQRLGQNRLLPEYPVVQVSRPERQHQVQYRDDEPKHRRPWVPSREILRHPNKPIEAQEIDNRNNNHDNNNKRPQVDKQPQLRLLLTQAHIP